jgi:hypothetical protein
MLSFSFSFRVAGAQAGAGLTGAHSGMEHCFCQRLSNDKIEFDAVPRKNGNLRQGIDCLRVAFQEYSGRRSYHP